MFSRKKNKIVLSNYPFLPVGTYFHNIYTICVIVFSGTCAIVHISLTVISLYIFQKPVIFSHCFRKEKTKQCKSRKMTLQSLFLTCTWIRDKKKNFHINFVYMIKPTTFAKPNYFRYVWI